MPNWCSNYLEVYGPESEVRKLIESVKHEEKVDGKIHSTPLSFKKIIPEPDNKPEDWDWYKWHCDKWGTKWDAYEVEFYDPELREDGSYWTRYSFETAWAPPFQVIEKLINDYPQLHFKMHSEEPGMGFGAVVTGINGKIHHTTHSVISIHCPYCGEYQTCKEDKNGFTCENCDEKFWEDNLQNTVHACANNLEINYDLDGEELEE